MPIRNPATVDSESMLMRTGRRWEASPPKPVIFSIWSISRPRYLLLYDDWVDRFVIAYFDAL